MGSNTEKKQWTNQQNSYKNWSKENKSKNIGYCKVGRAITKWGAIEKSPILLSQYWKIYHLWRLPGHETNNEDEGGQKYYFFPNFLNIWHNA